ncbi:putative glycosyl transferase [Euzebya pacifica]|uniref:Putative glycosyl transferase n=1 Tax=Euzebya pacifica TaxID=1608957 RepID=A0A346XT30_9ACTN|nr:glycosyltransferase [Euzebya pacifica]AXV05377.1 putative glycosyl transferase [Euzebya pacifica]
MASRLLFSTTAGIGHLHPLVPLARAAHASGHHVRVAAPASLTSRLTELGLAHDVVPDRSSAQLADANAWFAHAAGLDTEDGNAVVLREIFGRINTAATLPRLLALVDEWAPDLVIHEALEFSGPLAAEAAGVAHATVAMSTHGVLRHWRHDVASGLAGHRASLGLAPDATCDPLLAEAPYLTSVPASIEGDGPLPRTTIRYRSEDLHDVGPAPGERDPGRPLLWATFGTEAGRMPGMLDRVVLPMADAVGDLDVDVLLTTGHAYEAPPLPANVTVERYVPQEDVLAHATAVWCHGGFNTTLAALRFGRPLVISPLFAGDTWFNAERVAAVGAGVALHDLDAASIRAALERVLVEPRFRARAVDVAAEMAAHPPPGEALASMLDVALGVAAVAG